MKRTLIFVIGSIVFLVVSNIYYYNDTYNWQIDTHKKVLEKDLSTCSEILSDYFSEVETSIMLMLNEEELGGLFNIKLQNQEVQKRIELLYNRYSSVLNKLEVYDNKGHFYALSNDPNQNLITTYGKNSRIEEFKPRLVLNKKNIIYTQPLASDSHIFGYAIFTINLHDFYDNLFRNFHIENHEFQWLINSNKEIIYSSFPDLQLVKPKLFPLQSKATPYIHMLKSNGRTFKVMSLAQNVPLSKNNLTLVFQCPLRPLLPPLLVILFLLQASLLPLFYSSHWHFTYTSPKIKKPFSVHHNPKELSIKYYTTSLSA